MVYGSCPGSVTTSDVKIAIVSYHLPDSRGPAAARILHATCSGLLELGHEVHVWSWQESPPAVPPPTWCTWAPLTPDTPVRSRARSLVRPRDEAARAEIDLPHDAWVVADDPFSFPAVRHHPRALLTVHYLTELDAVALRRVSPAFVQRMRAERRAVRRAGPSLLLYSERVRQRLRAGVTIPVAYPMPGASVDIVQAPVGACVADWRWPPNRRALATLLGLWPEVRDRLHGAELLLAGHGLSDVGSLPGVEVMGFVHDSREVLERAAALVFPCPASSGPKIKTIEALAVGLPVLTTTAGAEGVHPAALEGAVISNAEEFANATVDVLADAPRRALMGAAGRRGVGAHHAPRSAAQARVDAIGQLNQRGG